MSFQRSYRHCWGNSRILITKLWFQCEELVTLLSFSAQYVEKAEQKYSNLAVCTRRTLSKSYCILVYLLASRTTTWGSFVSFLLIASALLVSSQWIRGIKTFRHFICYQINIPLHRSFTIATLRFRAVISYLADYIQEFLFVASHHMRLLAHESRRKAL